MTSVRYIRAEDVLAAAEDLRSLVPPFVAKTDAMRPRGSMDATTRRSPFTRSSE